MKTFYKIDLISISKGFLFLIIDGRDYKFELKKISDTLAKAKEEELKNFEISPSGYGIHWPIIDEDISIPGLLKNYRA